MINDYLTLIIPASIGAIVATIGHYIYYRYTIDKENKRKFLEKQITDLLQPLYIHFKRTESENIDSFTETFRENTEAFVKVLLEDTEIEKIVTKKLYLASPDLSSLLLQFLDYQYVYEFELNTSSDSEYILKNYEKLRDTIYKEYKEKVSSYIQR